ncbi:VCBS repeat-containing protein [Gemmata sp. JC673]|uniref:VCBS repeat-containing protein n=1 Tax=Gemmata algarum TaxID=2975278 RepID=A0ABU5EU69_9BACT|nr:VCBS repeat-containing protein [Gemmata algarum]MDY3558710.1 VCBS repeat-containing protein [Gemmata algarum]
MRLALTLTLTAAGLTAALTPSAAAPNTGEPVITWKKTVLDTKFRSEGVAVADVNKDGKIDVLNGEYWYEAPDWKAHELQPFMDHKDGLRNYSRVFACWTEDLNGDGYADLIVIDFPGAPCYWMENPKGKAAGEDGKPLHWKKHIIWHSACNETPLYTELTEKGKRVLIMGSQPKGKETEGQMAYFTPNPKDPTALWEMHPISEPSVAPEMKDGKPVPNTGKEIPGTRKFSHGLGVGDINGDGRADVMCVNGWWEQPAKADGKTAWTFHPANLGAPAADMYAYDMDGDGKADVISSSAHQFGIWYHKQRATSKDGHPTFEKVDLFPKLVSETHAAHFKDIDGDGRPDLITGKRWWSHGRAEPGSDGPAAIYWFKNTKGADGIVKFTPMTIDEDSGIGTQFEVADINGDGLLDVISSNKKGVRVIVQERKK